MNLRLAFRQLLKSPGFTVVAIVTLALGIGACTTMFSVIETVMLRPLPMVDQDRLVAVWGTNAGLGITRFSESIPNLVDYRDQSKSFTGLAAMQGFSGNVTDGDFAVRLEGQEITANYTTVLGWHPILGRRFTAAEDQPGAPHVALISEQFWREQLGADPAVIGRKLDVNGEPHEIVGVLGAADSLGEHTDIWRPLAADLRHEERDDHNLFMLGRLRPGMTIGAADAEMKTIADHIREANPDYQGWSVRLEPLYDVLVPPELRTALVVLFAAVGCVLLIACANVANLLFSRVLAREREFTMRLALGASRRHLVAHLLSETALLAFAGTVAGVIIAFWGVAFLRSALPDSVLRAGQLALDPRGLTFAAVACVVSTLLAGLLPSLRSSQGDPAGALHGGARTLGGTPPRNRVRSALVVAQFSLSTVLLVGAGLLLQSFWRLQQIDPGFRSTGVMTFQISPNVARYREEGPRMQLYHAIEDRLGALPGVSHVGLSSGVPFGGGTTSLNVFPADPAALPQDKSIQASWRIVSPGYFETMSTPLRAGRDFTRFDTEKSEPVVIISEGLARRFWPHESALGKHLNPGGGTHFYQIVGVAGDATLVQLTGDDRPQMYIPLGNWWGWETMTVAVKADVDPATLAPAIRTVMHDLDPAQPVFNFRTMDSLVATSVQSPRLTSTLLAIFAALALGLAAVGIYGVMATSVARRTNEIGIRMALGAQIADVLRLVLVQGLRLAVTGVVFGLAVAFASSRLLTSLLYDTPPTDPTAYLVTAALLGAAALLACWLPARRAARVDPIEALRAE